MKKYALLSVFDKTGIVDIAQALVKKDYEIISTGGTATLLQKNKIPVTPIQDITGNPECFDGRMKTISFQVEGGILFDRANTKHCTEAKKLKVKPIDVVICNLYPFEQVSSKNDITISEAVENIDVGGPTMIRSAAKNFTNVMVLTDPTDYTEFTERLQSDSIDQSYRQSQAAKAFGHLSFYDSQIARFFSNTDFPQEITLPGRKMMDLRYGENAHQKGAIYIQPNIESPFRSLKQIAGRGLSLTNITDINAGIEVVRLFNKPAAVVIKHNTPCGIALGKNIVEAIHLAIEADPESAFGGVIVTNQQFTLKAANIISDFKKANRGNMDIVSAPDFDAEAIELLKTVRKTTGLYSFGRIPRINNKELQTKWISGGFVLQTQDLDIEKSFAEWKIVTEKKPTKKQIELMQIGWKCVSRIRSNTILIMDKDLPMTRGIGSGQTSRIRSTKLALEQAKNFTKGAILVSDSFFPFDDSVTLAAKKGISAIVQQGGSINDQASIDAANKADIAMVFTDRRAFWH